MSQILALQTLETELDPTEFPCFSVSWSGWSGLTA